MKIMRLLLLLMFISLIYMVSGKNNVKTLTESMGQEVIEIGTPIKELPMGLEEEPAADDDDATHKITSNTIMPATKKDVKKPTVKDYNLSDSRKKMKDVEKIDGMSQEDEEARIEKELAEIYKDTAGNDHAKFPDRLGRALFKPIWKKPVRGQRNTFRRRYTTGDYKSDSAEEPGQEVKETPKQEPVSELPSIDDSTSSEELDKPIGRQKNNFKFQPDTTDKAEVERFRTSIDEISCNNRQKLSGTPTPSMTSNRAYDTIRHGLTVICMLFCYVFMCT